MAKTKSANKVDVTYSVGDGEAKKKTAPKKTFEERLERLEELGNEIRKTDIPLDEAIKAWEEGFKLAQALEKELKEVESRVEIVMNDALGDTNEAGDDSEAGDEADKTGEGPVLGLFDDEE